MNRKYLWFWLILIVILSACSQVSKFEPYEGKALTIAVIGELPKIKENQVEFTGITFDQLKSGEFTAYDAVFIMENQLSEASKAQYADVYLNSTIPFFFMNAKSHILFTNKDMAYDQSWEWSAGNSYAVGVLVNKEEDHLKSWGYGLHNEEKTDETIMDVYSRIFKEIDGIQL